MTGKLVRLVALSAYDEELGAIDGDELTISVTDDAELVVTNGHSGLSGPIAFGWEDLVPGYRRGEHIRLEIEIVDSEEAIR